MKVLVVEDVDMARLNMRKALEKEGIEVIEAENGNKALELFEKENPDVVSLDILMPGIDGLSVLKEMKSLQENLKAVIVTAMDSQHNFVEAFKYGAKYFLVKPIDLSLFVDRIKSLND